MTAPIKPLPEESLSCSFCDNTHPCDKPIVFFESHTKTACICSTCICGLIAGMAATIEDKWRPK